MESLLVNVTRKYPQVPLFLVFNSRFKGKLQKEKIHSLLEPGKVLWHIRYNIFQEISNCFSNIKGTNIEDHLVASHKITS